MTDQEFRELVAEMRHAQKEYFRVRSSAALDKSKTLEKRVDQAMQDFASKQGEMF